MKRIEFFGLPGSGKTTVLNLLMKQPWRLCTHENEKLYNGRLLWRTALEEHIKQKTPKADIIAYARARFDLSITALAMRRAQNIFSIYDTDQAALLNEVLKNYDGRIENALPFLKRLDMLRFDLAKVNAEHYLSQNVPKFQTSVVVHDEQLLQRVASISLQMTSSADTAIQILQMLPRSGFFIYFSLPVSDAENRISLRPRGFKDASELDKFHSIFLAMTKMLAGLAINHLTVDATSPPEVIISNIRDHINSTSIKMAK